MTIYLVLYFRHSTWCCLATVSTIGHKTNVYVKLYQKTCYSGSI